MGLARCTTIKNEIILNLFGLYSIKNNMSLIKILIDTRESSKSKTTIKIS